MLNGFCPSYDNPGYIYPGPYVARTESQLNKQAKHTQVYIFAERISFAEHWMLVAESSEFQLALSRAYRAQFFQLEIRTKKAGHFKRKARKRDGAKNHDFTPESGNIDTYNVICRQHRYVVFRCKCTPFYHV